MRPVINKIDKDVDWAKLREILYKYIRSRVNSKEDAEDILQESLIKIYKNLYEVKDNEKIKSWIYTITKNTLIDFYRKQGKSEEFLEQYLSEQDQYTKDFSSETFDVHKELGFCLRNMIDSLPIKYRKALILTEFNNLTQKDMAARLNLSVSGAKSRVQRGRKLLKDMMVSCCILKKDCYGNVINYKHKNKKCDFC